MSFGITEGGVGDAAGLLKSLLELLHNSCVDGILLPAPHFPRPQMLRVYIKMHVAASCDTFNPFKSVCAQIGAVTVEALLA